MAKILFYKVKEGRSIHLERSERRENVTILELLNSHSISESCSTIFLNNRKIKDLKHILKRDDLLFVFINN